MKCTFYYEVNPNYRGVGWFVLPWIPTNYVLSSKISALRDSGTAVAIPVLPSGYTAD